MGNWLYIGSMRWLVCSQTVTHSINNHFDCFLLLHVFVPSDIADCPTSRRSGRHIIPPLAWWRSERMLIDPLTHTSKIVCDSPLVKASEPTDKLSCRPTLKSSDLCTSGWQNKKRLEIRVKKNISLEFSASVVGKGTDSLVLFICFV